MNVVLMFPSLFRSFFCCCCFLLTFFFSPSSSLRTHREANIFQDGGGASDNLPLEGILSFGKGIKELDPFENEHEDDDE